MNNIDEEEEIYNSKEFEDLEKNKNDSNIDKNNEINNNNQNNEYSEINNNLNKNNKNYNSFRLFNDTNEKINLQSPLASNLKIEEENKLLSEIELLKKEKQQFYIDKKAQSEILQKNIELLYSLSKINQQELTSYSKNISNDEINNLFLYNSKLNEIESEERIIEEDKNFFEQYKFNFNQIYEERKKEIEKLKLDYEQEKSELYKKLELLEAEEKMINDKYNNFEMEKNILTQRYNNAINKESSLNNSKIRIENNLRELDKRNMILDNNYQILNKKKKEIENEIIQNNFEKRKICDQKNNLKMRQDMIDSLRMKYIGDITNNPFDYGKYNKNINNGILNINQDNFNTMNYIQFNENNDNFLKIKNEKNNDTIQNNIYPKLSVINEEDYYLKNSSNKQTD